MSFRKGDRAFHRRTGDPVIVRYVSDRGFVDIESPDGRTVARVEDLTLVPPVLFSPGDKVVHVNPSYCSGEGTVLETINIDPSNNRHGARHLIRVVWDVGPVRKHYSHKLKLAAGDESRNDQQTMLDSYPHGRATEQIHNQKAEEEPMSETVTIALTAKDIAEWHGGGSYVTEKITALLPDPSPLIEPGLKYRHVTANPDTVNWERVRLVDWESDEVITETVDGGRHVQPLSRIQDQFHLGQLVEIEEQA